MFVFVSVYMCVCLCGCVYVCVYACASVRVCVSMSLCCICVCGCVYVCYVCICEYISACVSENVPVRFAIIYPLYENLLLQSNQIMFLGPLAVKIIMAPLFIAQSEKNCLDYGALTLPPTASVFFTFLDLGKRVLT